MRYPTGSIVSRSSSSAYSMWCSCSHACSRGRNPRGTRIASSLRSRVLMNRFSPNVGSPARSLTRNPMFKMFSSSRRNDARLGGSVCFGMEIARPKVSVSPPFVFCDVASFRSFGAGTVSETENISYNSSSFCVPMRITAFKYSH